MIPALVTALLSTPPQLFSNQVTDRAVIWNGFDQTWGYNHRVNRLGDYAGAPNCDMGGLCMAQVVHAAATGTGTDVADFRSHVTTVESTGVGFLQGATVFHVEQARGEGRALHYTATEHVRAAGLLAGRENLAAMLGGFDLRSKRDPDKLSRFAIAVGDVRYEDGGQSIVFSVDLTLQMDCDTAECDVGDRAVDYDVSVMWTLMGADDQLHVTPVSVNDDYAWLRARPSYELDAAAHQSTQRVTGLPGRYAVAFTAFQSLSVELDHDHHMQAWSTALRPLSYDPASGAAEFDVSLLFKQWNRESRRRVLSFADRGSAAIRADVALVQLSEGSVAEQEVRGSMAWQANGRQADVATSATTRLVGMR